MGLFGGRGKSERRSFSLDEFVGGGEERAATPLNLSVGSAGTKDWQKKLAMLANEAPTGDNWFHELKFDGYRMLCRIEKGKAEFFSRNGQGLLPMVDLIEQSRLAVDELINVAGRATIRDRVAVIGRAVGGAAGRRRSCRRRR